MQERTLRYFILWAAHVYFALLIDMRPTNIPTKKNKKIS